MDKIEKQLSVRFEPEIHRRLKVYCAGHDISINTLLNDLVKKFLDEHAPKQEQ